jgi:hypothetical protein
MTPVIDRNRPAVFLESDVVICLEKQQAVPITQTTAQAKAFLISSWITRRIEKEGWKNGSKGFSTGW